MTTPPIVSITDELIAELDEFVSTPIMFAGTVRPIQDAMCALLAERAELKRQVEGLKDTLAGVSIWMKDATDKVLYPVSLNGSDYVARTAEGLGSCTPGLFKAIDAAMQP